MKPLAETLIDVRGLTVDLPAGADRRHAVRDVSFELRRGEIFCIVGESGSGKSVTAAGIMGLLPHPQLTPSAGSILFEGSNLLEMSEAQLCDLRGSQMAMIFQEPMTALNPIMRVGAQVAEVLAAHGISGRRERQRRVLELFESVGLPEPRTLQHAFPFRLSGGQRQRVMIAMALALEPTVLIADEPTTALDVTTQAQILALIKEIQSRRRMGTLFITHDFGVVAEIADRVAVMQNGQIVEMGRVEEVLNRPQHPYTRGLIAAVPRLEPAAPRELNGSAHLLRVRGLNKTYRSGFGLLGRGRKVEAVSDVSFTLRRGETLGLVGESGSGKSTVGRCLVRLTDANGGEVLFDDLDLAALSRRALRPHRKRIQMVFQDPYASLNPRRRVGRIVAEGPLAHGASEKEAMDRARELLSLVGLSPSAVDRFPHEFSGGQRQRVGIARALALEPDLLIADEAVSALDVSVQAQVLKLLDEIRHRFNLGMLFITHDLRVAARICDSIAVMQRARIVEYGPTAEVFNNPRDSYTRQLLDAVPGKHWIAPEFSNPGLAAEDLGPQKAAGQMATA